MQLFNQPGPSLGNTYLEDPYLQAWSRRNGFAELDNAESQLQTLGALAGGELYQLQLADRLNEPLLTQWDAWGNRIDRIDVTPLWQKAEKLAAEFGLVALPYQNPYGALSRQLQFSLVYLFTSSADIYSCPLAMTDGAARTLSSSRNAELIARALPHLTSRDPKQFWTSGQWMTELPGGSDVGRTETIARFEEGQWRLYGRKWFTSATTSQMTLTLARPEGNGPGGRGLALFYLETRDQQGLLKNIEVNRLKDKLGTRKVPTAELLLKGTPAELVMGTDSGVRNITPMLNITRTWNAVSAISLMRRGLTLAWDYAHKRVAFGASLINKPLHRETLLQLEAEFAGAFFLTFEMVKLLGQLEASELDTDQQAMLRVLTPLVKLSTGKQAVAVLSEVLECFGGAGYVEDTGLPLLLRDAQVLPIWEGTTNVLSLDTLRALNNPEQAQAVRQQMLSWAEAAGSHPATGQARQAIVSAFDWLLQTQDPDLLEGQARRFALTLARSLQVIAIGRQAQLVELQTDLPLQLSDLMARYLRQQPLDQLSWGQV